MNPLILSTLPHLLTVSYTLNNRYYTTLVVGGTLASVIWHTYPSSKLLYGMDALLAILWFLYEMRLAFKKGYTQYVISSYGLVFFVYVCAEVSSNYIAFHTIFHLVSSIRSFYTAKLLYGYKYYI